MTSPKALSTVRSPRPWLDYTLKKSWRSLLVGLVAVVVVVGLSSGLPGLFGAIEPALAVVTLAAIWLIEKRRQWIDSLPKRLSVYFWAWESDEWKLVGGWEDAFLAGEDDIRATAQSLGQVMYRGRLDLLGYLYVVDENPPPIWGGGGEGDDEVFRRYEVHIPLGTVPGPSSSGGATGEEQGDGDGRAGSVPGPSSSGGATGEEHGDGDGRTGTDPGPSSSEGSPLFKKVEDRPDIRKRDDAAIEKFRRAVKWWKESRTRSP